MPNDKQYKVTQQFTDGNGRTWMPGETFQGDGSAVQQAGSNIQEQSAGPQSSQSAQSAQAGQSAQSGQKR